MTVVAVLAAPPRPGLVGARLAETAPVSPEAAAEFYAAALRDTARAVAGSGGDLIVNYRDTDTIPEDHRTDADPEAELRETLAPAVEDVDEVRFETQVGSSRSARIGNTVTHLLEGEDATSAAVVPATAPLLTRGEVDNAAMKLRRAATVLGPAPNGDVYYAGFTAPIDFDGADRPPATETLVDRARDAGHDVDFLPMLPVVESGADLATLVVQLRARRAAGVPVPEFTAEWVADSGLVVRGERHDDLELVRE